MKIFPDFDGVINWDNFQQWMEAEDLPGSGPITDVANISGGSQNHLFLVNRNEAQFIIRRPPKSLRANSNKTMLREARLLKALKSTDVPCPTFYGVCDDTSVIGACFYVMSPLEGQACRRQLPGRYATDASWRRQMGIEFVRAAAKLGNLDYKALGLEDYGKPDNWHDRQVKRWRSQLDGYCELDNFRSDLPYVDKTGEWLTANLPVNGKIGIIHGDYQFPNVMFSLESPKVTGLIDWELSTLGDPLLDLGWLLSAWSEEGDPPREPQVSPWDGFLPRSELIRLYGEFSGRDMSEIHWYAVLACYKLGCILEGTYARALAGKAPMATGERLHNYALWLFKRAKQLICET